MYDGGVYADVASDTAELHEDIMCVCVITVCKVLQDLGSN